MSKVAECAEAGGQTTCVPEKFQSSWGFQIAIKIGAEDISNFQTKNLYLRSSVQDLQYMV